MSDSSDTPDQKQPRQTGNPNPVKRTGIKKGPQRRPAVDTRNTYEDTTQPEKPLKGLASVIVRNEFYKDGYRALRTLALIQGAIILVLIFVLFFVFTTKDTDYVYFATTEDGRLVPMTALNEPNLSKPALMSWVAQAATETMTFNFRDFRKSLQEASRHFTRQGWASFTQALQNSGIIETVQNNKQVVSAAPLSAPVIVQEGIVDGRYQWNVEMPMTVTYEAGSQSRSDTFLIRFVVVRVPKLESPNGVGIEQWVAVPQ
ncbi:MAG: type IV secretion protein IcmL [Alphaproteobacteria bacterium]|nr:type IV secretion protein IcmL [Alphaproteobacteria bacterium]|tara:strand:- start:621 stop:1397 length:777 start_codon:yes stop_codon:yes gene_type:complete